MRHSKLISLRKIRSNYKHPQYALSTKLHQRIEDKEELQQSQPFYFEQ